jgi:hypothetical protein
MSGGCYTLRGAASLCGVLPPQRQSPAKAERPRKQGSAGPVDIVAESRTGDWLIRATMRGCAGGTEALRRDENDARPLL